MIMMMIRFLICFCLLCSCVTNIKASKKIEKITIKKVDFRIETPISVTCKDFEKNFENVKEKVIVDKGLTEDLLEVFSKKDFQKNDYIPDVRAKVLILFSDGTVKTICVGSLGMLVDDESVVLDKKIFNFVNNIDI